MREKISAEVRALLTLVIILVIGGFVGFWIGTRAAENDAQDCTPAETSISVDVDHDKKKVTKAPSPRKS